MKLNDTKKKQIEDELAAFTNEYYLYCSEH